MRRVFLDGPLTDLVSIGGSDAHHLVRVLRLKPGDRLTVVGTDGEAGEAVIKTVGAENVTAQLTNSLDQLVEPPLVVWLAQSLPKGDKMDLVVQKAVELGVHGVIPVAAEHSVVRYDAAKQRSRQARWQKIAHEAGKQCGRGKVPFVTAIMTIPQMLRQLSPAATLLMPYEGETTLGMRETLAAYRSGDIIILIGPEGGFSPAEVDLCQQHGAKTVSLGPRILRTETAAIAALTMVMYQCGDLGG